MADGIERELGEISARLSGIEDRLERQNKALFGGNESIDGRVKSAETDIALLKSRHGLITAAIAGLVSGIMTALGWLLGIFGGRPG